jgi:ATP-dependent Lhr-like helicase
MRGSSQRARNTAGRWSLLAAPAPELIGAGDAREARDAAALAEAQRREQVVESAALVLLWRYGIVFRDLLERESTMPRWRDLLGMLRRLEARGIVRGGRFLSGFPGEQFALPQAVESLRESRKQENASVSVTIAACDPANLVSIVVPGDRTAATPGRTVQFRGGHFQPEGGDIAQARDVDPVLLQIGETGAVQLSLGHD